MKASSTHRSKASLAMSFPHRTHTTYSFCSSKSGTRCNAHTPSRNRRKNSRRNSGCFFRIVPSLLKSKTAFVSFADMRTASIQKMKGLNPKRLIPFRRAIVVLFPVYTLYIPHGYAATKIIASLSAFLPTGSFCPETTATSSNASSLTNPSSQTSRAYGAYE